MGMSILLSSSSSCQPFAERWEFLIASSRTKPGLDVLYAGRPHRAWPSQMLNPVIEAHSTNWSRQSKPTTMNVLKKSRSTGVVPLLETSPLQGSTRLTKLNLQNLLLKPKHNCFSYGNKGISKKKKKKKKFFFKRKKGILKKKKKKKKKK